MAASFVRYTSVQDNLKGCNDRTDTVVASGHVGLHPVAFPGDGGVRRGVLLYYPESGDYQVFHLLHQAFDVVACGELDRWWSIFVPFVNGAGDACMLMYSSTDGRYAFTKVTSGGPSFDFVVIGAGSGEWWCGFTHMLPYTLDDRPHYMAYMPHGVACFCRFWDDGGGENTLLRDKRFEKSYSSLMPYEFRGEPHLFAYKFDIGSVHLYRLIGELPCAQLLHEYFHGPKWLSFMCFDGSSYVAYGVQGRSAICTVAHSGPTGVETHHRADWQAGWSDFVCPDPRRGNFEYVALRGAERMGEAVASPGDPSSRVPSPWPQPLAFQLLELGPDHHRWEQLAACLCESLPNAKVKRVVRVCHPELYMRFAALRRSLREPNAVCAWHSTSSPLGVCAIADRGSFEDSLNPLRAKPVRPHHGGVNPLFASEGAYGQGAYAARFAHYSRQIWKRRWPGDDSMYMLLYVEVLLGKSRDLGDDVDYSLRGAPPGYNSVQGTENSFTTRNWDMDREQGRQYVTYQPFTMYPHYIVGFAD